MNNNLLFKLKDTTYNLRDISSILIGGVSGCGKTTIIKDIIKEFKDTDIVVLCDSKGFEYKGIASNIKVLEEYSPYYKSLTYVVDEFNSRIESGNNTPMVIIIDELSDIVSGRGLNNEILIKINNLIKYGKDYGMYFIISTQRTTDTVINKELLDNSGLKIVMKVYKDTVIDVFKDGINLSRYEYIIRDGSDSY